MNDSKAKALLIDAMQMLEDIERARELPSYGQVYKQYIALGREIREFLQDEEVIQ